MSKMKWIRYTAIGLLILGSLTLTTVYTHWEFSILTGLFLAILSKGMRRSRYNKINQRFPDVEG
ncbi:hypothetical protein VB834_13000 [Limnoraphis robusta Tam1]|uniref:Uncharacterized protein n=1 Tax=Limnoraphis robusta CS-951 TaxID=1637645 RepID=A0A0F5YET9_9CYAN|nr:hypothetical protein [Limnoraphis robusta]KKD37396.1 hypothetical protein WN50_14600 [Limnoraphis robusta CS-951]MEA5501107.1 hypothetical protein [Limnoraphis robusta BA-68 BA1]MEA5539949.1 hypothetical protein [Limnoraphis robusta Tam1]